MSKSYEHLVAHLRQISLLGSTQMLLGWDQEVMMPGDSAAAEYRSRQLAQIATLAHQMQTDPRLDDWLSECEADADLTADPHGEAATNIREARREYEQAVKLPATLVEQFIRTTSLAKHAWAAARRTNDFAKFQPWLEQVIYLSRARAECWGHPEGGELWDALADHHEPGMYAGQVTELFTPLKEQLVRLMRELLDGPRRPGNALAGVSLPCDRQRAFNRTVAERIGFAFSRGRSDESNHPFCLPLHRDDVRMTSRYREAMLLDGLGSTMHEAGHGLYNQNLPAGDALDLPAGMPLRFAVHESQARMMENQVGRSRAFWDWCGAALRRHFCPTLDAVTDEQFFEAGNIVVPSLIRTEADELTYNLHIMVRFELERALIRGDLKVADLSEAWRQAYRQTLGIEPPDDARGCLQDIHWAMGAIGYFPTYTLGNIYAAQLFEAAERHIPDLQEQIGRGEFKPLVQWLNQNVHCHGRRYTAQELIERATDRKITTEPLLRHLRTKLAPLYGVKDH